MAYTYNSFLTALATELAIDATDTNLLAMVPSIIDDSEQRCYRDLDLVSASVKATGNATPSSRIFAIPQTAGHIIVLDIVNVLDAVSTRHPVVPATRETIEFLFPTDNPQSIPSYPRYFARVDDTNILWGPAPDTNYTTEVVGTIRPNPLSATNQTTFLTNYLSDLFFAGAMVSAAGYMRNFGMQADDPRQAVSWEQMYQTRLASAKSEELRKQYKSALSSPPQAPSTQQ